MAKTLKIFCAGEQELTDHTATIDQNGEWLFTCEQCARVLKYSASMTSDEVKAAFIAHQVANEGQLTQAVIDAKISQLEDL